MWVKFLAESATGAHVVDVGVQYRGDKLELMIMIRGIYAKYLRRLLVVTFGKRDAILNVLVC